MVTFGGHVRIAPTSEQQLAVEDDISEMCPSVPGLRPSGRNNIEAIRHCLLILASEASRVHGVPASTSPMCESDVGLM